MTEHVKAIDISAIPELAQLAEDVHRTHEPRVLRREGQDLALVVPLPRPRKRRRGGAKTAADDAAFRSAAGGWADIDTDKLIEDIYESRRISTRPPVELCGSRSIPTGLPIIRVGRRPAPAPQRQAIAPPRGWDQVQLNLPVTVAWHSPPGEEIGPSCGQGLL